MDTPCYVIVSNGFKESVSFSDDGHWRDFVGEATGDTDPRDLIKANIRAYPDRNGAALYFVSDHGNVSRRRRVTLRRLAVRS